MSRAEALAAAKSFAGEDKYQLALAELKKITDQTAQLTEEERGLLYRVYKKVAAALLAARSTSQAGSAERRQRDLDVWALVRETVLLLDGRLIPSAGGGEPAAAYLVMRAVAHSWFAPIVVDEQAKPVRDPFFKTRLTLNQAVDAFAAASNACRALPATSTWRLREALERSTFTWEYLKQRDQAIAIAQQAFEAAMDALDGVEGDAYMNATTLMHRLRDTVTYWQSDRDEDA